MWNLNAGLQEQLTRSILSRVKICLPPVHVEFECLAAGATDDEAILKCAEHVVEELERRNLLDSAAAPSRSQLPSAGQLQVAKSKQLANGRQMQLTSMDQSQLASSRQLQLSSSRQLQLASSRQSQEASDRQLQLSSSRQLQVSGCETPQWDMVTPTQPQAGCSSQCNQPPVALSAIQSALQTLPRALERTLPAAPGLPAPTAWRGPVPAATQQTSMTLTLLRIDNATASVPAPTPAPVPAPAPAQPRAPGRPAAAERPPLSVCRELTMDHLVIN
ncbi:hypothetical protein FJT64_003250 [Amphibalanus amphitrite]|uniref:Uncharacterized protein n=1 Tax=Amphibalanus amphitrite TaxID=1232801 RepID=A0A6A4VXR6_AMPAM|nr:hypothetical protein FJT64_003250 [Amphibalanus amphitrite]